MFRTWSKTFKHKKERTCLAEKINSQNQNTYLIWSSSVDSLIISQCIQLSMWLIVLILGAHLFEIC